MPDLATIIITLPALDGVGIPACRMASLRSPRRRRLVAETIAGQPGVVRDKLRPLGQPWPRRIAHARVVHDVLVVNSGPALVRTTVHGVEQATAHDDAVAPVKGIDDPMILTLRFDDRSHALLAVPAAAQAPFETLTQSAEEGKPDSQTNADFKRAHHVAAPAVESWRE